MTTTPKIFIVCSDYGDGKNWIGHALAQDGTGLVEHLSSSKLWLRHDMGLTSGKHHDDYNAYYPNGYQLVDYIDATNEELMEDQEFIDAHQQNNMEEQIELDLRDQQEGV